jgi:hypothetical protein
MHARNVPEMEGFGRARRVTHRLVALAGALDEKNWVPVAVLSALRPVADG